MRVTPKMLRQRSACEKQVREFEGQWPEGCHVTLENCMKASKMGLDLSWAACNLLPTEGRRAYFRALLQTMRTARPRRRASLPGYERDLDAVRFYKAFKECEEVKECLKIL